MKRIIFVMIMIIAVVIIGSGCSHTINSYSKGLVFVQKSKKIRKVPVVLCFAQTFNGNFSCYCEKITFFLRNKALFSFKIIDI